MDILRILDPDSFQSAAAAPVCTNPAAAGHGQVYKFRQERVLVGAAQVFKFLVYSFISESKRNGEWRIGCRILSFEDCSA